MKCFSLVIPVYNEEETLNYSFNRIVESLKSEELMDFNTFEVIFVNDGSKDKSTEIIQSFIKNNKNEQLKIKGVYFSRNFGHSSAVLAGLNHATGDVVGIIDADLQDPPELLGPMYSKLETGYEVVYGQRLSRESESAFKKFTAWGFYRLLHSMTSVEIPKDTGDFRIMTQNVKDEILKLSEQDPFLRGLVAWVGFNQVAYPYEREGRKFGTTKYPFKKMLKFALNAMMSFSGKPLYLGVYLSVFYIFATLVAIGWVLFEHFSNNTVAGWSSLLIIILFGQAVMFAVLGVFGAYLFQIHRGVQNRPRYILRESKDLDS